MAKPARKLSLVKPVKLDLGCGKHKAGKEWTGVDSRKFDGVDQVVDLCARVNPYRSLRQWPWENDSVDEIRASHFVEHLEPDERRHFVNECFRILKPGGTCQIITPHWNSCRAYGDLTHKWPPVSEFWFNYLNKAWRDVNAPHDDGYTCDFEPVPVLAVNVNPIWAQRAQEAAQFAVDNYREAVSDLMATIRKPEV